MANLISLDRALSMLPAVPQGDETTVAQMITAASGVVENYCRRVFAKADYDELYTVAGATSSLFVSNPPINKINNVRAGMLPALYLQCLDGVNQVQKATVQVTTTAVVLDKIFNNVDTSTEFSFEDYPTFELLADAINLHGDGWRATKSNQFNKWQTADMVPQGSYNARNVSISLLVYWWGLAFYQVNQPLGEIYNSGGMLSGYQYYRIQYEGGYDPIPEEIQYAVATMVQLMWASRNANPLMTSETLDKYSYSKAAEASLDNLGAASKMALNNYKLLRVAKWK